MIELEKKLLLAEKELKKIETTAQLVETKIIADTYFDTADFRFTTSDLWLRERDCLFELKRGLKRVDGYVDRYQEIKEECEILQTLGLETYSHLRKALKEENILPFASFQTIRRKYRIQKFSLDLDLSYFEDFVYRIAELELEVETPEEIPLAEKEILAFIQGLGLENQQPVRAKLIEYLFQKKPNHYQALVNAGIVKMISQEEENVNDYKELY